MVGRYTIAALNRTRGQKIQQIDANLERWRWLPAEFPERYILVNVADFHLRAMRRKRMELSMPVIVGLPERQTPVFTETMKYLVFNPFWEIPRRIAVVDQLPKLRADAKALAERGFEAAPAGGKGKGGPTADPAALATQMIREFDKDGDGALNQARPQLSALSGGGHVVTWLDEGGDGSHHNSGRTRA